MGHVQVRISKYRPSAQQGQMDFSVARAVSMTREHPLEARILKWLLIALAVLLAAYLYLVCASVLNVISRKEALQQVSDLQGSIGSLEQRYFALSQTITPQAGATLGLSPVSNPHYVYRAGHIGAANTSANEI